MQTQKTMMQCKNCCLSGILGLQHAFSVKVHGTWFFENTWNESDKTITFEWMNVKTKKNV